MNTLKHTSDKWIVTSANELFFEGVVALNNSIKKNSPECKLAVMAFGSEDFFDKLLKLDITVIKNPPMLGPILDEGKYRNLRPIGPDMFARLVIPKHFEGRVFYVDADCLILKPIYELWELDLRGMPSACVFRPDIGWIGGHIYDDMASGTLLLDCNKWEELYLVEKCFKIVEDRIAKKIRREFGVNVESVLSYMHNGKFIRLPAEYQNLTYYGQLIQSDKVAHFAGPKPWFNSGNKSPANYFDLWKAYYTEDYNTAKEIEDKLPTVRGPNPWNKNKRA